MPKVHIRTYGCQMNERDSEQVARMFTDGGYTVTADETDADAILVNTCSVRDQAEQKALGKMGNMGAATNRTSSSASWAAWPNRAARSCSTASRTSTSSSAPRNTTRSSTTWTPS
jgi:hypothetical protein